MLKQRIGLVFGGRSVEHKVSLQSAKNILAAIDKKKYEVILLGIDKQGKWHLNKSSDFLLDSEHHTSISLRSSDKKVLLSLDDPSHPIITCCNSTILVKLDVIFPIIHGKFGEDGSLQGLLRMINLPFVGSDVLSSAVSMDKDFTKRLLSSTGLKVAPWFIVTREQREYIKAKEIINRFGLPLFVKPSSQGSSVGISKVDNIEKLNLALDLALTFDRKVLIEKYIKGREIECGLLGNNNPEASPCGEIIVKEESFYTYNTKYIKENGAVTIIPAKIDHKISKEIQAVAITAFRALECLGMARVDVFLTEKNEIVVNEVNTLPGFTEISMYPKLWEAAGLSYKKLISRLIELAQEHYYYINQLSDTL